MLCSIPDLQHELFYIVLSVRVLRVFMLTGWPSYLAITKFGILPRQE